MSFAASDGQPRHARFYGDERAGPPEDRRHPLLLATCTTVSQIKEREGIQTPTRGEIRGVVGGASSEDKN